MSIKHAQNTDVSTTSTHFDINSGNPTQGIQLLTGSNEELKLRNLTNTAYMNVRVNDINGYKINTQNIINVKKNPGSGEFLSISAAVASILDASVTNPYTVSVGPGLFIEPQIIMKPYITISGSGDIISILQAVNPSIPLIVGTSRSEINNCHISGTTGNAGVYYEATVLDPIGVFYIRSCLFENNYYHVHVKSSVASTNVRLNDCRVVDSDTSNTPIFIESTNGFDSITTITNMLVRDFVAPYPPNFLKVTGPNAVARILSSTIRANGSGAAFWVADGGTLRVYGCEITNFATGIFVENVGAAPRVVVIGTYIDCVTWDFRAEHPNVSGHFQGSAALSKIYVNPSANYSLNVTLSDSASPYGGIILGDIAQGVRQDKLFNLTKLTRKGSVSGVYDGGILSYGTGLNVNISSGSGFLEDSTGYITEVTWASQSIALPINSRRFIYFTESGTAALSASQPDHRLNILLGSASSNSTEIEILDKSPLFSTHFGNNVTDFHRDVHGSTFVSGCLAAEVGTRTIAIGSGFYYFGENKFKPSGGSPVTFTQFHQNGSAWVRTTGLTQINNTSYDTGTGTLVPLTAAYFAKHVMYVVGEGANEKYFVVIAQQQYSSLVLVEAAALPTPPEFFMDGVIRVASFIVHEGVTNIVETLDERPTMMYRASTLSAASTHGNLLGLSIDDHQQYLLVNGNRAMAGTLNMSTNNITNLGTANGVTIEGHASRHLPNGLDPITTATAIEITDTTNSTGVQNSLSHSDHVHAHGNRSGGTLHAAATTSVNGFMSSADKTKLDAIGGGRIIKSALVAAGSFAGNPKKYTVTFGTAFASTNYTISIIGVDSRTWSYESKTSAGFVINTHANAVLTGEVSWTCINTGETVEQ